jgi:hypothetical protein
VVELEHVKDLRPLASRRQSQLAGVPAASILNESMVDPFEQSYVVTVSEPSASRLMISMIAAGTAARGFWCPRRVYSHAVTRASEPDCHRVPT